MNTKETIVYFDGGDDYKGRRLLTAKDRRELHKEASESGQVGYLSGYRYFDNKTDSVLVYFTIQPSLTEIERRRGNGLKAAKWHWLNIKTS